MSNSAQKSRGRYPEFKCSTFHRICALEMRPLSRRYNLKFRRAVETTYTLSVEFANSTTGVIFDYERREGAVTAYIARLVGGEIIRADPTLTDDPLDTVCFDDLWTIRSPVTAPKGLRLELPAVRVQVNSYVLAILQHAMDVLEGDFAVFPKIERIIRKRNRFLSASELKSYGEQLLAASPDLERFLRKPKPVQEKKESRKKSDKGRGK